MLLELAKSAAAAEELERKRMEAEEEAQRLEEKRKEVEEEKVRMELLLQSETQEKEELVSVFITLYLHVRDASPSQHISELCVGGPTDITLTYDFMTYDLRPIIRARSSCIKCMGICLICVDLERQKNQSTQRKAIEAQET